jgi:hypothetical protein
MALSPLQTAEARVIEVTTEAQPSKTYKLNVDTIGGLIDDDEALRQFITKAVTTARSRFLIYDDDYGCEIEDLIGADVTEEYLNVEIPRIIREALVYDDRIDEVVQFEITRDGDCGYVSFRVVKTDGTSITEEVTF